MNSLRRRLTVWLLSATAILAVASGASLYLYLREAMYKQFDAGLRAKAQAIGSLTRIENDGSYAVDFSNESMPEYRPRRKPQYFQIFLPSGKTLARSASLKGQNLLKAEAPHVHAQMRRAWNLELPNGEPGRAMALSALAQPENEDLDNVTAPPPGTNIAPDPVIIVVAQERSNLDRVLTALLWALILAAVVLAVGGILVVRFVVWQALQPVCDLAERARGIGPKNLDYRFNVAALPEELRPICQRLNDLLERLDEAFARERRLNSDIAHELRTPIAELRSLTEVACRWPLGADQATVYFHDAHEIAIKMGSLIERLFVLARGQTGTSRSQWKQIELFPVVRDIFSRFETRISDRCLTVSISIPEDIHLHTDSVMFNQLVENLVSNSVAYATRSGTIQCAVEATDNSIYLIFANSSDSLVDTDLGKMFEPFWRKDAARSGDRHSGLGLALIAEYARQLDISLRSDLPAPDWLEIRLLIPAFHAPNDLAENDEPVPRKHQIPATLRRE